MTLWVDISGKHFINDGQERPHQVLEATRFETKRRSFTCIVGPSGCGKTTLMNIIGGLETPDSGDILLDDQPVTTGSIGYMFQNPRLMPWLSALDNVLLVMDKAARQNGHAAALLREMGLGDSMAVYANRLSGGMQRRVALARAFINQPPLLLMDEPFVSLDEPAARKLRLLLLRSWREQIILFVTHNLHEAVFLSDRILFLSSGPGAVVLDYTVPLPRPRESLNEGDIAAVVQKLLAAHPHLLGGIAGADTTP